MLYFHIPFCTKKCDYCHFYVLPDKEPFHEQLMEGLQLEWQQRKHLLNKNSVTSIYFGGGTPLLFGPRAIGTLIDWCSSYLTQNVEITLEANPEHINREIITRFKEVGVNRISIGVQSLSNPLLKTLSRTHSAEQAEQSVLIAKEAGIDNITIDLMYDIPHQSLDEWNETLKKASALPITHLSLYNLTFEPETVFFKKRNELTNFLPKAETSRDMYLAAIDRLEEAGLIQYEISAFAKPGFEARHNSGYWRGVPFLGLGPSAFSYWDGRRLRNVCHLKRYHTHLQKGESPIDFEEQLDNPAQLRELFVIELRLVTGVPLERLKALEKETLNTIEKLISQNLLLQTATHICLTDKGRLFYDTVATELV